MTKVLFGLLAAGLLAGTAIAQKPHIERAVASDQRQSLDEHSILDSETPKVYVVYTLHEAPRGARVRAVWWIEKAEGYSGTKLDEVETQARGDAYMGAFSYGRPTRGWPLGTYRVDLFVDGRLDKSVRFQIVR
jgi:hypothetical protein